MTMTDVGENDEALIDRYARGDAAAFTLLYKRHEMRVWRYLECNVGNQATADELLQEVWFAVARDAPRYRASARFTSWLFTIAHNRMIDSVRASRPQMSLETLGYEGAPVVEQLTSNATPLAAVMTQDQASALKRALQRLPCEQREAFLLQAEGDLSVEEICAITHSSFETTKSRLRYARTKLRELLSEYR